MRLLFPLYYLRLENAFGRLLIRRDVITWVILALLLAGPFLLTNANFFHKDGFVDKIGSFSAVLIGFYVAALIAVATLSSRFADLDLPITDGEVRAPSNGEHKGERLSRREYVCYMFGYMAFISLILAVTSQLIVVLSPLFGDMTFSVRGLSVAHTWVRGVAIIFYSVPLVSLALTTVHGLYYLVERLYDERSRIDNTLSPDDDK